MARKDILKLLVGFKRFRERYFGEAESVYQKLSASGQTPKTLVIGCSDSRVDPAILTSAEPGDLFVIRNVANLVPPFEDAAGYHGVSSAIEFAVVNLRVENVVILGHRQCGGVRALMSGQIGASGRFVGEWVQIAQRAKDRVLQAFPHADFESQCRECEKESIAISIENLKTFPFVQEAIRERGLFIFGTYFDLESGELLEFDEEAASFKPLEI